MSSKKLYLQATIILCLAVFLWPANVLAGNITIHDEDGYTALNQGGEDNETEPGMIRNQYWDLEGIFQDNNALSLVGGFDFRDGYLHGGSLFTAGDIFIDVDGDAQFGTLTHSRLLDSGRENFGYDYVFDVDWTGGSYSVYELLSTSRLTGVSEGGNDPESNPFGLLLTDETLMAAGTFGYEAGLTNAETGFAGMSGNDAHYRVSGFDLDILGLAPDTDFIAHFTISCGNDNLMGTGTTAPVPEPATMFLFGSGLIGLAGFGRKKLKANKSKS